MRRLIKVDKCEDAAAVVKEYEKKSVQIKRTSYTLLISKVKYS